jgi:Short C-terminal domain
MTATASPPRRRRATAIIVVASVIAFLATFAVWINRQVMDTDEWTKTSSQLLEQQSIRNAVATYLVDQLYANVDVAGELRTALPPQAKSLAGPAAGGLREFALRVANRALASPKFQQAWENANRTAHQEFVAVVRDQTNAALSTTGGNVVLNLEPLLEQLSSQIGLGGKLVKKIPPDAAQLTIMRSNQLDAAQKIAKAIRGLAILLPLLWLALAVLGVYLARGRRREAIRAVAFGGLIAGIAALLLRGAAGNLVTNALAKTASVKPAVDDAWEVSTSLLTDVAQSVIAIGLLLLIVAWLAGSTRPAVAFRRFAAPYMRERPAVIYAVVAAIFLILVAWHPAHIFTRPLALLLLAVFMVIGTEALRRQTEDEFPNAVMPEGGIREWLGRWRSGRSARSANPGSAEDAKLAQLERLAGLRDRGVLSQQEFEAQKAALLGQ